jgi:GT2 family glycosyltransferase
MNKVDVLLILRDFPYHSVAQIQFDSSVKLVKLISRSGLSDARNYALKEILLGNFDIDSYDYISFLDDDCQVTALTVENLSKYSHEEVVIGSYGPDFSLLSERFKFNSASVESLARTLDRVASCTLYFKPNVIKSLKYFYPRLGVPNKDYTVGEDTEYFLRANSFGFRSHIDPSIFIVHPYKDSSRVRTIRTDILLTFSYLKLDKSLITKLIRLMVRMLVLLLTRKISKIDFRAIRNDSKNLVDFVHSQEII